MMMAMLAMISPQLGSPFTSAAWSLPFMATTIVPGRSVGNFMVAAGTSDDGLSDIGPSSMMRAGGLHVIMDFEVHRARTRTARAQPDSPTRVHRSLSSTRRAREPTFWGPLGTR
jgi:hypothetical protein